MGDLSCRRIFTENKILEIKDNLNEASNLIADKACIYMTGSFGRGEASIYSDLDLFIVGDHDEYGFVKLKRLDEIIIKADLIKVTERLKIPKFSGDGRYLVHYPANEIIEKLGKPDDDNSNTFTARLLLLLESKPLLGEDVYKKVIMKVIDSYWRDYEDHKSDFIPAFLINDILRLWRTFCINYEARIGKNTNSEKIKAKIKNYKLKYSRLLTCYSAIICILAIHKNNKTISSGDLAFIVNLTPTGRLEYLLKNNICISANLKIENLIKKYNDFLFTTNKPENELENEFGKPETSNFLIDEATKFGDLIFEIINLVGSGSPLHRLITV